MFNKRMILAGIFIAALSSPPALAQISDDVVKIGVLTDMNGPAATATGQIPVPQKHGGHPRRPVLAAL